VTQGAAAGRLIVFEGGEGSGKSTQLRRLSASFARNDISHVCLREPGGTPLGTEVRRLVLLEKTSDVTPRAEALLFMVARAQLVEREIRPALARGDIVLLDRFFLSTYAYQVAGQGLPEEQVRAANAFATAGIVPDLTLLLTFPVSEGLERAGRRAAAHDRIEALGSSFHDRVAAAFASHAEPAWQAAHPECGPIVAIKATGTEEAVGVLVQEAVARKFPMLGG
jgi:dTMP kinase